MPETLDAYYWDSCIFYALLKGEEHREGELAVIKKAARLFDEGKIAIATSVFTHTELIEARLPEGVREHYKLMTKRSNFHVVDVTERISDLAQQIRDYYYEERDDLPDRTVSTQDAIHIASAIQSDCPMWTLDSQNKSTSLGLTKLSMPIMGKYEILITRPEMGAQQELDV